eukprot:12924412-Alexandrium_andersonii.AAC.1
MRLQSAAPPPPSPTSASGAPEAPPISARGRQCSHPPDPLQQPGGANGAPTMVHNAPDAVLELPESALKQL